jgi:hypothetical protein
MRAGLSVGNCVILSSFLIFVLIDCIEFVQQPYPLRNGATRLTGTEAGPRVKLGQCR